MPSTPISALDPPASSGQPLLAVPNVSEGRDRNTVDAIARALTAGNNARLLNTHADADHHRSVYTLAGTPGQLSGALLAGAREAIARIDVGPGCDPAEAGQHPHVGAVDVVPIVYTTLAQRGAACAEALVVGSDIGERLNVPVFLYGILASGRTRAELRRGGLPALTERMAAGELTPDFGPPAPHPTAGATLVAAREPLVAFNLELAPPATLANAKSIAALIREGGPEGLPGLRAIGVTLREGNTAQVSTNVERPLELALCEVVAAVAKHADVARTELVGLAPRAAMDGFPSDVPLANFDPGVDTIENALGF